MTRIDFYVLSEQEDDARFHFAARLTDKAFRQNLSVLILAADSAAAQHLDLLLWRYPPESFLPHSLDQAHTDARILLTHATDGLPMRDLLINLSNTLPATWQQFARVAEVVSQSPQVLNSTRARYAQFKEQGYQVMTHKLG